MPPSRKRSNPKRSIIDLSDPNRDPSQGQSNYREQALRLFPHVCARCGREFGGKDLRELTVHHKDSDHMNNPPDGSNWELLCLYCHDEEHQKLGSGGFQGATTREVHQEGSLNFNPFANLNKPQQN
jgi:hypothetical protein